MPAPISQQEYINLRKQGFTPDDISALVKQGYERPGVTQETYKGKMIPQLMKGMAESGPNALLLGRTPIEAVSFGNEEKQADQQRIANFIPRSTGFNPATAAYWAGRTIPGMASMAPYFLAPEFLGPKIAARAATAGPGIIAKGAQILSNLGKATSGPIRSGATAMGAHGASIPLMRGEGAGRVVEGGVEGALTGTAFGMLGRAGATGGKTVGELAEYAIPGIRTAKNIVSNATSRLGSGLGGAATGMLSQQISGETGPEEPMIYGALGLMSPSQPYGTRTPRQAMDKVLDRYYRVVKGSTGKYSSQSGKARNDLKNFGAITDIAGNVEIALPETKALPTTVGEALVAADNLKRAVIDQSDAHVTQATGQGAKVDARTAGLKLWKYINTQANRIVNPAIVKSTRDLALRLVQSKTIPIREAQDMIQNLNAKISASSNSMDKNVNDVDALLVNGQLSSLLREGVDFTLNRVLGQNKGAEWRALRKRYGNLRNLELELSKAGRRLQGKDAVGLASQIADPFIAMKVGDAIGTIARVGTGGSDVLSKVLSTTGVVGTKLFQNYINNPNRHITLMFKEAAKHNAARSGKPGALTAMARSGIDFFKSKLPKGPGPGPTGPAAGPTGPVAPSGPAAPVAPIPAPIAPPGAPVAPVAPPIAPVAPGGGPAGKTPFPAENAAPPSPVEPAAPIIRVDKNGKPLPVWVETKYSPEDIARIKKIQTEINEGEPGYRYVNRDDYTGEVNKAGGIPSTYPHYFQNKGYEQAPTDKIINNVLSGKKVTEKQKAVVDDLLVGHKEAELEQNKLISQGVTKTEIEEANRIAQAQAHESSGTQGYGTRELKSPKEANTFIDEMEAKGGSAQVLRVAQDGKTTVSYHDPTLEGGITPLGEVYFRGSGGGGSIGVLRKGAGNILGDALYLTKDKSVAKLYGKNITEHTINLKKPLVINDDMDFAAISLKSGNIVGNPLSPSVQETKANIQRIRDYIDSQGYDGVVINNVQKKSNQLLNKLFEHDQTIVFNKPAATSEVKVSKEPFSLLNRETYKPNEALVEYDYSKQKWITGEAARQGKIKLRKDTIKILKSEQAEKFIASQPAPKNQYTVRQALQNETAELADLESMGVLKGGKVPADWKASGEGQVKSNLSIDDVLLKIENSPDIRTATAVEKRAVNMLTKKAIKLLGHKEDVAGYKALSKALSERIKKRMSGDSDSSKP